MAVLVWPRDELPPRNFRIDPSPRNLRGPASIDGPSQIGASDAGLWVGQFTDIPVHQQHGKQRIELWHAIAGIVEGRLTPIVVPVFVAGRRPLPDGVIDADIDYEVDLPHSDDSYFDDDSGYETGWIEVSLSTSASRRATQVSVTKSLCGEIRSGMRFSVGAVGSVSNPVRLYQVKRIVSQMVSAATFTIWPPLREALSSGARTEWARPHVQMRLASDNEMDLMLQPVGLADPPTINLLEDL
ncbi:hypothetical protein [Mesorhizobium sp. Z1-4]|uniref:hypothetical protein n=1 Tax=Mesorhizobium sp. Z1-4 TaxID=2448478 RepID=UPI001FDFA400|nr:hypothetical protein [Mesorhizobium sp. Z1-4]